jgi:hypothetical protein
MQAPSRRRPPPEFGIGRCQRQTESHRQMRGTARVRNVLTTTAITMMPCESDLHLKRISELPAFFKLEFRVDDAGRPKSGGQILFHAADARGISLSQRFPGLDCVCVGFVVDEGTPSCVKSFPLPRNDHQHIRGHASTRLCKF